MPFSPEKSGLFTICSSAMREFLKDFLIYPFDSHPENNKFSQFLTTIFKDYPAFLWHQPTWKKLLVLPLLIIYAIFRKKQ